MSAIQWLENASQGNLEALKQLYNEIADKKALVATKDNENKNALFLCLQNGHYHLYWWLTEEARVPVKAIDSDGNSLLHISAVALAKFGPPSEIQLREFRENMLISAQKIYVEKFTKVKKLSNENQINSKRQIKTPEELVNEFFQEPSTVLFKHLLRRQRLIPSITNKSGKKAVDICQENDLPKAKEFLEEMNCDKAAKLRLISNLPQALFRMIWEYL